MRVEWRPVWSTVHVDDGRRGYIELAYNCLQPPLLGPRPRFSHARSSSPIIFTATAPTAAADAAACKTKQKKFKRKLCKSAHGDTQHLMMSTVNCMRCRNNSKCDFPLGNNRQKSKQQLITIPHWTGVNKNHQIFSARMIYLLFIDFPPCCFKWITFKMIKLKKKNYR